MNVTIPELDGISMFIDTRNSVFKERVSQLAKASLQRIHDSSFIGKALGVEGKLNETNNLLNRIHYKYVASISELVDTIHDLKAFMATHRNVRIKLNIP